MTGPWSRLSLRARLLTVGVLGVAAALAIGSVALYAVLTVVGYRSIDSSGVSTAHEVGTLVQRGRLPDPIPVTGDQVVQVVDARGRVVTASADGDRLTSLLLPGELVEAVGGSAVVVPGSRAGLDSPLRVVAVRVTGSARPRTVLVAQQFDDLVHSQHVLRLTLLLTYPLLLAVLTAIAWRVVGAALGPVEALRSSAERISGSGREERLPVPAADDEIHALAVTLNSMLGRLADSRARQRSFVADAAHELRSPLASMQTQLEVAHRLGEDTPGSEDLRAEVSRMSALVEDLLVLARIDAEQSPHSRPEPVPVDDWFREVASRQATTPVPVTYDAGPGLRVLGQRDQLGRLLANLVGNAVRHAATGVRVTAAPDDGDCVVVTVDDDGAGIAAADRERVFERFTRLDEARDRDAGGSGLGLAIVGELVERNHGTVRLGDAPEGGLRVTLRLPAPGLPSAELSALR